MNEIQQEAEVAGPPQHTLSSPLTRRRHRRIYDMIMVHQSSRLSNHCMMSAIQHAQRNLCRKLGLLNDEVIPVEAAL